MTAASNTPTRALQKLFEFAVTGVTSAVHLDARRIGNFDAMIESKQHQALIETALVARERAYAPYSNFLVGAAVLTESGEIVSGANVENASYGLTICAERVAAGAAVAAGARVLQAVAIVSRGGAAPCGACRQFLAEFGGALEVVLIDSEDPTKVQTTTLDVLLPEQFHLER